MKQYMVLFNVDEEKLKESSSGSESSFEGELGWLEESGITAQSIVAINDNEYIIDLPSQRVLPEENLVVEVGGDIDYPRVSVMRDLGKGNYEELVRLENNSNEGIRSVTYIDQDGLKESETRTVEIYFTDPMEVLFEHFRIEAHSLSAQRLSYDEDNEQIQYDSPDVYGVTELIYISDRNDGFELCIENQEENEIIPEVAAFFKELDYDVDLFKVESPKKFGKQEEETK